MDDNLNRKKLSFGTKLGYGLGAAGDAIPYNLFYTYFVFYLTNVAGISPAIAGTISMISIIWSACVDPVVGFMSDNSRNSKGRRIPMMSKSIWPLAVVMIFLYIAPTGLSGGLLVAYFIFACILLWTFYSTYGVPYGALGAELTNDYNERNILRLFTGLCSYPFVAVVNSGVMAVIAFATARGVSYERSWTVAAAAVAAVAVICCSISVIKLKGKEPESHINTETERIKISGIFKEYIPILKQKTFRRLMWYGLVWIIGYNTFSTVGVYIMTYCAGLDEAAQSKFWLIYTVIAVICTPIPVFVANKIGKKPTLFGFSAVFVIGAVIFYITSKGDFYVRNSDDYMAKMISLAGGKYIMDGKVGVGKTGTTKMEAESFFDLAKDADEIIYVWSTGGKPSTLNDLLAKNSVLADMKAVKEGNVWCTTPDFFQIGNIINDMNSVFSADASADKFTYLYKLK